MHVAAAASHSELGSTLGVFDRRPTASTAARSYAVKLNDDVAAANKVLPPYLPPVPTIRVEWLYSQREDDLEKSFEQALRLRRQSSVGLPPPPMARADHADENRPRAPSAS